ncbi:MAG TPA: hypothetical protein VL856_17995 [Acidimicrobiia bacterium]|jgi:hypothetical protein|nr:hypothetical protein [Acidimicrobiia bacterium]
MRCRRFALAALVAGTAFAIPLLTASPAHAALGGPCTASGTFVKQGKTYDAKTTNKATIPLKDDVKWKGAVPGSGKRPIAGNVRVKLPWPLPKVEIGSWGSNSDRHANAGKYHYDFPKELAGFDIPLTGIHTEKGISCPGAAIVRFSGSGFSNPAVIGTFVLTIISGVALIISFRPRVA